MSLQLARRLSKTRSSDLHSAISPFARNILKEIEEPMCVSNHLRLGARVYESGRRIVKSRSSSDGTENSSLHIRLGDVNT